MYFLIQYVNYARWSHTYVGNNKIFLTKKQFHKMKQQEWPSLKCPKQISFACD